MNKKTIDEIRESLPQDFNMMKDIVFDEPEDVLLWLEELVRYDIVRISKAIELEEDIDHDITKLNEAVTKRLKDVIKIKRTKAEKGELKWEDL